MAVVFYLNSEECFLSSKYRRLPSQFFSSNLVFDYHYLFVLCCLGLCGSIIDMKTNRSNHWHLVNFFTALEMTSHSVLILMDK